MRIELTEDTPVVLKTRTMHVCPAPGIGLMMQLPHEPRGQTVSTS